MVGKVTTAISLLWVCWETRKEDHQRGRKNYPVLKKVLQDSSLSMKKENGATSARRNRILEMLCSDQAEFDLLANYTTHDSSQIPASGGPGSAGGWKPGLRKRNTRAVIRLLGGGSCPPEELTSSLANRFRRACAFAGRFTGMAANTNMLPDEPRASIPTAPTRSLGLDKLPQGAWDPAVRYTGCHSAEPGHSCDAARKRDSLGPWV